MGTYCEVRAWGEPEVVGPALDRALDRIARLEQVMTTWSADGELARLNERLASDEKGGVYPVSSDLARALGAARSWAERSGGRFDPTVGSLSRVWSRSHGGDRPSDSQVAAAVARTGWRGFEVDPSGAWVRTTRPGLRFDLGGIGKGVALDAAAEVLAEAGIDSALFNFGGQVLATGPPPGQRGWQVEIADPRRREAVMATVFVDRGSVATSGASERFLRVGGEVRAEIFDPRTGQPRPPAGAVSVVTVSATDADALSTALYGYQGSAGPDFLPPQTQVLWLMPVDPADSPETRSLEP